MTDDESLSSAVDAAVDAMHWLLPSDQALVALARQYASGIDAATATGDQDRAARALFLGPHLLATMRALGGAPTDRRALIGEERVAGRLAHLRSERVDQDQRAARRTSGKGTA